jgi:hypothetical protein
MSYRDDLQAAHGRIAALEAELRDANKTLERSKTIYRDNVPVMRLPQPRKCPTCGR